MDWFLYDNGLRHERVNEKMEQFKCCSLVSKNNVKEVIVELSKQGLYQKPHLMGSCLKSLFYPLKTKFPNTDDVRSLYQTLEPTNKKVISCIIASPQKEAESECLQYFKKYIRSPDTIMLKHLLCFLTGEEILVVEAINVTFKKNESKFTRRPIVHTCGPCLEFPPHIVIFVNYERSFQVFLKSQHGKRI